MRTFDTPFSRYKFFCITYGILSATEFIKKKLIKGFEGAQIIYDDILVTGKAVEEYDETWRNVRINFERKELTIRVNEVKHMVGVIIADRLKHNY